MPFAFAKEDFFRAFVEGCKVYFVGVFPGFPPEFAPLLTDLSEGEGGLSMVIKGNQELFCNFLKDRDGEAVKFGFVYDFP